ncbi:hypothetical protein AB0M02_10170 [Actinoplanes sp. NPDC051861]|uniref:hypothetical protein n=1 Tax=Actinoplanes sp. NPDC051861 TaxID=3155170 RepID=UPI00344281B6
MVRTIGSAPEVESRFRTRIGMSPETGSEAEGAADTAGNSCESDPSRLGGRFPPMGPSLNPNEARPGPAGEAGPNAGAAGSGKADRPDAGTDEMDDDRDDGGTDVTDDDRETDAGADTRFAGAGEAAAGEAAAGDSGSDGAGAPPNQFTASPPRPSSGPSGRGRRRGSARSADPSSFAPATTGSDDVPTAVRSTRFLPAQRPYG